MTSQDIVLCFADNKTADSETVISKPADGTALGKTATGRRSQQEPAIGHAHCTS